MEENMNEIQTTYATALEELEDKEKTGCFWVYKYPITDISYKEGDGMFKDENKMGE